MPARWPSELRQAARDGANRLRGTTSYTLDLAVPMDLATTIQQILDRYRLRAFHCTRLLDWEVTDIRRSGLRVASDSLINDRLDAAVAAGVLRPEEATLLEASNVLAHQRPNREHLLSACTTRRTLDEEADGLRLLLTHWGGEIIYFWQQDSDLLAQLETIGRPAIVVVLLDTDPDRNLWSPDLANLVIGRHLGLSDACGQVSYRGERGRRTPVEAVWLPGDFDYDRHTRLPRS